MILPIQSIPIAFTTISGEKNFMILEAPNSDDPFYFSVTRMNIRGAYRDRNNVLRRKFDKYTVRWVYDYRSHLMDLRKLLTAVEITLSAPPDFVGTYQSRAVKLINKEAVKNWLEALAVAGTTASSFDIVPSGSVQLKFEIKKPLIWQEVMHLKTFQSIAGETTDQLEAPVNLDTIVTDSNVAFSWDAVEGVDGYNLYLDSGSGFEKHNESLIETNSYLIEGIEGGQYNWLLTSVLGDQESDSSAVDSFLVGIFYTDFSEYIVDAQPNDWQLRWATAGNGWQVKTDGSATGGKVLRKIDDSTARRKALSWDKVDGLSDVRIEYKFKGYFSGSVNNQSDPRIFFRASGTTSETGIVHGYRFGSAKRLGGYNAGAYVTIQDLSFSADLDEWYFCTIEIEGNNHRLKMWKEGDSEPGSWDMEQVNSTFNTAGWLGLFNFGHREYDIDYFKVTKL